MNNIRNAVVAVVAAAALSLAGCSDVEPPATDIGKSQDKKSDGPAPKQPVRDHTNRMDFGDGKATLPAKPKPSRDDNSSRLDFGDNGRG